jgi:RNA polymerase sigma-70 factor (family 1)
MEKTEVDRDQYLLVQLAEGNEAAFMEIYERYWQKVFAVAYSRLKNLQDAEDIVHDVFASVWTNREKSTIHALDNYLATAAKYMVFARIKQIQKERNYKTTASENTMIADDQITNQLHHKRIIELIKFEVEKLPEKCRIIFKYSRYEGMSVKQIAALLNISPKTVENQLGKALKHVKVAVRSFLPTFIVFLLRFF